MNAEEGTEDNPITEDAFLNFNESMEIIDRKK